MEATKRVKMVHGPIDPSEVFDELKKCGAGSVLFHHALVKRTPGPDAAGSTVAVEYVAKGDVAGELTEIADDMQKRWALSGVVLIRRTGRLVVGDIISVVAVSSPGSADAFHACQYGIERLKQMGTVGKREQFE